MKSPHLMIIALISGALVGILGHSQAETYPWIQSELPKYFEPVGQIFLRLIFMVVVPMVLCGLINGVLGLTQHSGLARVAKRTLFFTILASTMSVIIGIGMVNIFKPGVGLDIPAEVMSAQASGLEKIKTNVTASKSPIQALVEIIPKNPLDSAVRALDGEMLSLMLFALIFGVALSRVLTARGRGEESRIQPFLEEIYETCMIIVGYAMKIAPIAVFSLVLSSTLKFGSQLLLSLGYYVLVVVAGLLLQQFGVYAFLLKFFTRWNPWQFFSHCREVYLYAFATASSNATLPKSLATAEHELKLNPQVSRFVLTVGSTANQNGTALFEGITVLFLAQVFHVDLTWAQQFQVVLMSILAGIGTAGVPGGSLPLIMILLQQMGIPPEGLGIILGVDRFLDMCRTTLNVSGDLVIAALVDEDAAASAETSVPVVTS